MKKLNLIFAGALIALLTGCSTHVSKNIPDDGVMQWEDVKFPDMDSTWIDAPTYPNFENLGKIEKGMSKDQVMNLLGHPHHAEGLFGVREWDYLFNLKAKGGDSDKICQFKLIYDKDMRVGSTFFNPKGCAGVAPIEEKKVELQSDFLFDFDKKDIKADGKTTVAKVAEDIKSSNAKKVTVYGYTDRLGDANYNLKLSQERAEAVKDELVRNGVEASKINAKGMGKADQVIACKGVSGEALKECLRPNRRVVIKFN